MPRASRSHSLSVHCIDVSGSPPANGVEGAVRIAKIDRAADYHRRTIERCLKIQPPLLFSVVNAHRIEGPITTRDVHQVVNHDWGGIHRSRCGELPQLLPGRRIECIHSAVIAPDKHLSLRHGGCRRNEVTGLELPARLSCVDVKRVENAIAITDIDDATAYRRGRDQSVSKVHTPSLFARR